MKEWVKLRRYDGPPEIGQAVTRSPEERVDFSDEIGGASLGTGEAPRTGRVVEVGAHWSNQPTGESGWWALVDYGEG
jgi:hypothetical protein